MLRLVFFGHRPQRLFPGSRNPYGSEEYALLRSFCRSALERIAASAAMESVLTGMALGTDQAAAEAALELGLPVEAWIPFRGMEARWPVAAQRKFSDLLSRCRSVQVVSQGGYSSQAMYRRNEQMIGAANAGAVIWDGRPGGGTWHGVQLLRQQRKIHWNFWTEWLQSWSRHLQGLSPATITGLPPIENF